ncbi:acylphosphatase [Nocardioides sp. CER19]|uniref:acylphosphatase n=1 Tax=Nocardioides sp. CER19 TaxID=3038538 RepID=UPI002447F3DC|nr:acylphosphatase [Nocardioides sp. CER19]MDH2415088.1 acylphosphatase [Nocardioides sp. CER19]
MSTRAVDVVVTGRVQGVFFRASCAEQAERLGVTGRVANRPDGSVSGHFEGDPQAVTTLLDWCGSGPRRAEVAEVSVDEVAPQGDPHFEVR